MLAKSFAIGVMLLGMLSVTNKPKNLSIIHQLIRDESFTFSILKPGDIAPGIVLEKNSKLLLVDLGKHGTGAVYGNELLNAKEMVRGLKVGDAISGKVVEVDNEDGYVELSITEAGRQRAWDEIIELKEKDEPIKVRPSGFNKGGLVIEVAGVKGFLPLSQLTSEHYPKIPDGDKTKIAQELQRLAKEEFLVKIIDIGPKTNKLIFSERAAFEEGAKELIKNYSVGQIIDGVVSGVANFGAFVRFSDNPNLEGLIHISELGHRIIENPKEVINVDDVIKVKIIEIKDDKVYLSLKALKPDPWEGVEQKYKEGQEIQGRVYSFNPFGAVIDLGDVQGQIHVTEFGGVEEMKQQLESRKEYLFIITSVKPEEKRIYLKLKK